ncbi:MULTISPECIES: site-specific integrase [Parabacteroides]|jgi:integrase/recombinase XerD|uniref:site-specific integrase n=1 Tax=Parabacteroides TaxID=375288 RepID=UPI0020574FF7|nr:MULTISPECIES: site-specific integrase [Parabacteroides]DAI59541.1 MAG TPA: Integrase [Caudoviricetes sp.]
MATYRVYQKNANQKGEAPIYISFYLNRKKIEVPTKISVPVSDFDKDKGLIKACSEFAKDKNLIIDNIRASINDIFVQNRLRNRTLTAELFWNEYRNPKNYSDFFSFCEQSQRLRFQEVKEKTKTKHLTVLKTLQEFKHPIHFDELTTDLFRKYILHCRKVRQNKEVTINKNIQTISIYLNEAVRFGYISENPVHKIKLRGVISEPIYLNEEELSTLLHMYNKEECPGNMHRVLEFFLFLCFSSLHIGDAKALTIEQIGKEEFYYVREKLTNTCPKIVHVPISDPLRTIIRRTIGDRKSGKLFNHIITDQRINSYLKEIALRAGIKKKLCAKTGRHTFATIYLRKTRDLNSLKDILGHRNIKQTLVYAHVLDQDRKEGIQIFNVFKI